MNSPNPKELQEKLNLAKKKIKQKKYMGALQLLQEIVQLEDTGLDKNAAITEAKNLVKKLKNDIRIWNFRISLISIFSATFLIIIMLSVIKVSSTQVEIHLNVREFGFRLSRDLNIFSIPAKEIGITHLDTLIMEVSSIETASEFDSETDKPLSWQKIESKGTIVVSGIDPNWSSTFNSSYLKLTSLYVDSGAYIQILSNPERANQINFIISKGAVYGSIDTGKELEFACSSCEIENGLVECNRSTKNLRLNLFDEQVQFQDFQQNITIGIELPGLQSISNQFSFGKGVFIDSISFSKFINETEESTIIEDGIINFIEMDNEKFVFREGDFVVLDKLKNFRIKKIQLDKSLHLILHGEVGCISTGFQSFERSRLPSWLQWFQKNPHFNLILATLIPVFLVILAIIKRLKIIEEI